MALDSSKRLNDNVRYPLSTEDIHRKRCAVLLVGKQYLVKLYASTATQV